MAFPFMLIVAYIAVMIHSAMWVIMEPANVVSWLNFALFWGGSLFNLLNPTFNPLR